MNPNTLQLVSGQANSETFVTMEYASALKRNKCNLGSWLILKHIPLNARSHISKAV